MNTISLLEPHDLADIRDGATQALAKLGRSQAASESPQDILLALDTYLNNFLSRSTDEEHTDIEELAFELGSLWGEQLTSCLGWRWIRVRFNEHSPEAIGVSSPDDSLVIYPFQTIFFYHERVLPVRVARSFEVLSEPGRVPMLPPNGLENVMDHIE